MTTDDTIVAATNARAAEQAVRDAQIILLLQQILEALKREKK